MADTINAVDGRWRIHFDWYVLPDRMGSGSVFRIFSIGMGTAVKHRMGPTAKKLRKRFLSYSHAMAVPHGHVWAIEISAGRQGVELLSDDQEKIMEFLSERSACFYIAEALEGL